MQFNMTFLHRPVISKANLNFGTFHFQKINATKVVQGI